MRWLAVLAVAVLACRPTAVVAEQRHTPGFPEHVPLTVEELVELVRSLLGDASVPLPGDVASAFTAGNYSLVTGSIRAETPRSIVESAVESYVSGSLTKEDLLAYLELLRSWYNSLPSVNASDVADYYTALQAMKALANLSGNSDVVWVADAELARVADALVRAMKEHGEHASELPRLPLDEIGVSVPPPPEALPVAVEVVEASVEPLLGNPAPAGGLPSAGMPAPPSLSPPPIQIEPGHVVPLAALAGVLATLLFATKLRFTGVPKLRAFGLRAASELAGLAKRGAQGPLSGVVEVYWAASKYVEEVYGVRRLATDTHREFLEKARSAIGDDAPFFEKLTQLYELARYAGRDDPTLHEAAIRAYSLLREKSYKKPQG